MFFFLKGFLNALRSIRTWKGSYPVDCSNGIKWSLSRCVLSRYNQNIIAPFALDRNDCLNENDIKVSQIHKWFTQSPKEWGSKIPLMLAFFHNQNWFYSIVKYCQNLCIMIHYLSLSIALLSLKHFKGGNIRISKIH